MILFVSAFTPRSLTFSGGYNLLPHNFNFKLPSDLFCLDLKITISGFFYNYMKFYLHLTNKLDALSSTNYFVQFFDRVTQT